MSFCLSPDIYRTMSGEKVTVKSENAKGDLPCVIFDEPLVESKKGLVVIQEWWGMNKQIKEEAQDIGKTGLFVTIVPDLYRGKIATDNEEANHLMSNLDWPGAVKDIKAAAQYLKSQGCEMVSRSFTYTCTQLALCTCCVCFLVILECIVKWCLFFAFHRG